MGTVAAPLRYPHHPHRTERVHFCSDARPSLDVESPGRKVISMTMTVQEYRANARQCLSWAESARDPEHRDAFFDLAATWVSAAAAVDFSIRAAWATDKPRSVEP